MALVQAGVLATIATMPHPVLAAVAALPAATTEARPQTLYLAQSGSDGYGSVPHLRPKPETSRSTSPPPTTGAGSGAAATGSGSTIPAPSAKPAPRIDDRDSKR